MALVLRDGRVLLDPSYVDGGDAKRADGESAVAADNFHGRQDIRTVEAHRIHVPSGKIHEVLVHLVQVPYWDAYAGC